MYSTDNKVQLRNLLGPLQFVQTQSSELEIHMGHVERLRSHGYPILLSKSRATFLTMRIWLRWNKKHCAVLT